uniref:Uncharacterized protein n=1 Tax=Meloidogyne enterolobii TaxID=390850 RepID=A0A6V7XB39_MELEN|nr:unnamed protein product [Meloidogyne enterolobii]
MDSSNLQFFGFVIILNNMLSLFEYYNVKINFQPVSICPIEDVTFLSLNITNKKYVEV